MLLDFQQALRLWRRDPRFTAVASLTLALGILLFGVGASDWATFALSTLVLFLAALAATYLPARRAVRIAPIEALRHE